MKIKKHFFSRNIKNIKIRISKPDLNEISKIFDLFLFQNVVILLNDISLKSRTISLLKALNISYYCLKRGEFIDLLFYFPPIFFCDIFKEILKDEINDILVFNIEDLSYWNKLISIDNIDQENLIKLGFSNFTICISIDEGEIDILFKNR